MDQLNFIKIIKDYKRKLMKDIKGFLAKKKRRRDTIVVNDAHYTLVFDNFFYFTLNQMSSQGIRNFLEKRFLEKIQEILYGVLSFFNFTLGFGNFASQPTSLSSRSNAALFQNKRNIQGITFLENLFIL